MTLRRMPNFWGLLALCGTLLLAGCKKPNVFVPPPPSEIGVALPLRQSVTPTLDLTGTLSAYNQVDLVARVQGVLQQIKYADGALAKPGDTLFVVDPAPYEAKLPQAEAAQAAAQASFAQADAEFTRQSALAKNDFSSRSTLDQSRAARDNAKANVSNTQAGATLAALDVGYTHVAAPFAGVVTAHQVSVGNLVGVGGPTKLATMVQMDPIYANFTLSEQDVQRIRSDFSRRNLPGGSTTGGNVPVRLGLMTETDAPHTGMLDYIEPLVDPATGTLRMRAVFANADHTLLPGYFVHIVIPLTPQTDTALLVPDRAIGTDQAGRYLQVVNAQDILELRRVQTGPLVGNLRVITSGLQADDRVAVRGLGRAVPGAKVVPVAARIEATTP